MFLKLFLFFIGFYILIKGADLLVKGASVLANKFKVSPLIVGLLISGIGTSIPEFATSFIGNLVNHSNIALGVIIGSNIFNILFILGFSALFFEIKFKPHWVDRDLFLNVIVILISLFFMLSNYQISRLEGLLMFLFFIFWVYLELKHRREDFEENKEWQFIALPLAFLMVIGGLIGAVLGGKMVVDGIQVIAQELGILESVVSLIIVGVGTSLPEFVITFVAALKKQSALALGNIIGSNIFDFLMILGVSAIFKPILVEKMFIFETLIALFSALFLYGALLVGEKYVLKKWEAFLMVLIYVIYLIHVFNF